MEEEKTKDIKKYSLRFKPPTMAYRLTHPAFVDQKIEVEWG